MLTAVALCSEFKVSAISSNIEEIGSISSAETGRGLVGTLENEISPLQLLDNL